MAATAMESETQQETTQVRPRAPHAREGTADYEWNEASDPEQSNQSSDSDHARDGMAALTSKHSGSGYLGKSS
ncbi:UNVERIFIED_CONTAM: hypothetical protein NY603_40560, partial [Bacteroidetes bacterium 56_B9]